MFEEVEEPISVEEAYHEADRLHALLPGLFGDNRAMKIQRRTRMTMKGTINGKHGGFRGG